MSSWSGEPELLGLGLAALSLVVATTWTVIGIRQWLTRIGRCPRCSQKVDEFRPDPGFSQLVCPYCGFAVARLKKLPLADGHLLQAKEYRFSRTARIKYAVLMVLCWVGLISLVLFSNVFRDLRAIQIGMMGLVITAIIWIWARSTQVYVATDEDITAQNAFRKKSVRWSAVQRVIRIPTGEGSSSLGVYTTRKRRWVWPQLLIPESIENVGELKGVMIFKAGLTNTAKPSLFSAETYEKLTLGEATIPEVSPAAMPTASTPPSRVPRWFVIGLLSAGLGGILWWVTRLQLETPSLMTAPD